MDRKRIYTASIVLFTISFSQNKKTLPNEGSIVLSDPSDGPVTTTLYPDKSKTDLFNISIGIGF